MRQDKVVKLTEAAIEELMTQGNTPLRLTETEVDDLLGDSYEMEAGLQNLIGRLQQLQQGAEWQRADRIERRLRQPQKQPRGAAVTH